MADDKSSEQLEKAKATIARKVHDLRKERRWTRAELSERLDLSQERLRELEHGEGSFTAEHFLTILRLFNATVSDFAPPADPHAEIQSALARLGASHLIGSADVVPSERLTQAVDVIREVLVAAPVPRLVTALGPVLVRHVDGVNLKELQAQLAPIGLQRRLGWLLENLLEAIQHELLQLSGSTRRAYARAQVALSSFFGFAAVKVHAASEPDVLDPGTRSKRAPDDVWAGASPLSRKWGIVTSIQTADFVHALREARAGRR